MESLHRNRTAVGGKLMAPKSSLDIGLELVQFLYDSFVEKQQGGYNTKDRVFGIDILKKALPSLHEAAEEIKEIKINERRKAIAECAKWLDDEQERFPNEPVIVTGDEMLEHFKT